MNWETPKIDWDPSNPEGVGGGDFNRIEGNIVFLGEGSPIQDIQGNRYRTCNINGQQWTVDNWRATKYNDGTDIPLVADQSEWNALTTPGYCKYDGYVTRFGLLYNFHAGSIDNALDIAPDGWRVPTAIDFNNLFNYLSDNGYYRDYINIVTSSHLAKSLASIQGWASHNTGGAGDITPGVRPSFNNGSGLGITPSGIRDSTFNNISTRGGIWSSSPNVAGTSGNSISIFHSESTAYGDLELNNNIGLSLKMVRDI